MEDFDIKLRNGKYTVIYDGQTTDFDDIQSALAWIERFQRFIDSSYQFVDDDVNDCVYM